MCENVDKEEFKVPVKSVETLKEVHDEVKSLQDYINELLAQLGSVKEQMSVLEIEIEALRN